jgi:ABC-type multidrug transport system fused ATPase/permease subunit
MIAYNLRLSLITFTVIPFIILFTVIFRKKTREIYRQIRRRVAGVNAYISEHISGMKIVQIFAVEKDVFNRFNEENSKLKKSYMDQLKIFSIYRPSMYILNIGAFALLIAFGGRMVIEGTITIGTIVVFQRYISKFFEPIQELAEQFNILQSSMASSERIFNLLDEEEYIENKNVTRKLEEVKGKIEFKNVWFQYKEDEWVLKDVSFTVEPGETAAFVGATGAGKTTIQNLISRYYDIQKGEILLDGINIKEFDLKELRKKIGQMQQDVFLFTGDIKSNIRLREENITEDDILKASKYVNADKFICKLENKYDQKVYERGATFSAGQRQLISFARTLAFDPDILILDEATANIDTETEVLIQDAMEKLMKGRTTLVVAHRLSTIQNADKIIVMHKGRIKEMGKHQELLANRGIYYNLYKIQYEKVI